MEREKEYRKIQIKTTTFVLSAGNDTNLQSNGTVNFELYPDVTDYLNYHNTIKIFIDFPCVKCKIYYTRNTIPRKKCRFQKILKPKTRDKT